MKDFIQTTTLLAKAQDLLKAVKAQKMVKEDLEITVMMILLVFAKVQNLEMAEKGLEALVQDLEILLMIPKAVYNKTSYRRYSWSRSHHMRSMFYFSLIRIWFMRNR